MTTVNRDALLADAAAALEMLKQHARTTPPGEAFDALHDGIDELVKIIIAIKRERRAGGA